jgi:tRNA/rRNA methyltransferase
MPLFPCRVVLVRPRVPENVGAAARVMRNFGFSDLVLVAPDAAIDDRQARRLSTHGESILDQARIVADFDHAVTDCVLVCATSARTGQLIREPSGPLREVMMRIVRAARTGPVAMVFGPERTGLTNEEVTRCQELIHIPAEESYPALNLAQAVAICLYELRVAALDSSTDRQPEEPAPYGEQEAMFEHLQKSLEAIHFLYGPKTDVLMHGLRRLISRGQPTTTDLGILHGLARQILWYVEHHRS